MKISGTICNKISVILESLEKIVINRKNTKRTTESKATFFKKSTLSKSFAYCMLNN